MGNQDRVGHMLVESGLRVGKTYHVYSRVQGYFSASGPRP